MKITVRKAKASDVGAIAYSWAGLIDYHENIDLSYYKRSKNAMDNYKRFVRRCLKDRNKEFYVALLDGKVVGHIGLDIKHRPPIFSVVKYGYIIDAFVLERFRKKGVLKALLKEAEKWFRKKKVSFVEMRISAKDDSGMKIWHKVGFEERVKMMHKKL